MKKWLTAAEIAAFLLPITFIGLWYTGLVAINRNELILTISVAIIVFAALEAAKRNTNPAHQTDSMAKNAMIVLALPLLFCAVLLAIVLNIINGG